MSNVIQFPQINPGQGYNYKERLDKMDFPSDELRHCVEDNLIPVLEKHSKLPPFTMTLELPIDLAENLKNEITSALQVQIN